MGTNQLNHFDEQGNAVMVDVTDKAETERCAVARGSIYVTREIFDAIAGGTVRKGDVLGAPDPAVPSAAAEQSERGF